VLATAPFCMQEILISRAVSYNIVGDTMIAPTKILKSSTNRNLKNCIKSAPFVHQTVRCFYVATQVCKPGSVLTAIYLVLRSLAGSSRLLGTVGQTICPSTALLRIEFTAPRCSHGAGGLLHRLFTLATACGSRLLRYLSVALVLRSPSAGVTCYPCPVEPGLSSPACFRTAAAAVRPGRPHIVLYRSLLVKYLANSFLRGYTIT